MPENVLAAVVRAEGVSAYERDMQRAAAATRVAVAGMAESAAASAAFARGSGEAARQIALLQAELAETDAAIVANARAYRDADGASLQWRRGLAQSSRELKAHRDAVLAQIDALGQQGDAVTRTAIANRGAGGAVLELARFTEDFSQLQYGVGAAIRATANQAEGLVRTFGEMRATSAATGATITSQFVGALKGRGGVLLAFAAVSTAAQLLGPVLADAFGEGTEAAREFKEAVDEARDAALQFDLGGPVSTVTDPQEAARVLQDMTTERMRLQGEQSRLNAEVGRALAEAARGMREGDVTIEIPESAKEAQRQVQALTGEIEYLTGEIGEAQRSLEAFYEQAGRSGRNEGLLGIAPDRPAERPQRGRQRREQTLPQVQAELAAAQRGIRALLDLGITRPAEAAEANVAALSGALNAALSVTKGESTEAVRRLAEQLIAARGAALRAAQEQDRLLARRQHADAAAAPVRVEGRAAEGVLRASDIERGAAAVKGLATETRAGRDALDELRGAAIAVADVALPKVKARSDAAVGALYTLRTATQAVGRAFSEAAGAAADAFLSGSGFTEAEAALEAFRFRQDRTSLREQFEEGAIGARELQLRMAVLNEQAAAFRAQFDPLTRATGAFFDAFKAGIRGLISDLVAATARALFLKYVIGGNFGDMGFGQILGGLLSGGGAPAVAPAAAAVAQATSGLAGGLAGGLQGGPQRVVVEVRLGGPGIQGGRFGFPVEAIADVVDAGAYSRRRTGARTRGAALQSGG